MTMGVQLVSLPNMRRLPCSRCISIAYFAAESGSQRAEGLQCRKGEDYFFKLASCCLHSEISIPASETCGKQTQAAHADQSQLLQPPFGISLLAVAQTCSYISEELYASSAVASDPVDVAAIVTV